jgi:DNA-binding winged helix-turn-helix (wHTH) protein
MLLEDAPHALGHLLLPRPTEAFSPNVPRGRDILCRGIGVLIRVTSPAKPNVVSFGTYEFNPYSKVLRKEGMRVRLEGQSLAILKMLLDRPGELVTREQLQKELWPADTFVDFEHSLNAAVKRLRAALNDSADHPLYIETLTRRGYRFIAPLDEPYRNRTHLSRSSPRSMSGIGPQPSENTSGPWN